MTNTVFSTAFRGFDGPQGLFIAGRYIEEIADHLGISAKKMRDINMYRPDTNMVTHFNQGIKDKWNKRGLANIPIKFGISFTALFLNQAGALVYIYHDDSVLVAHGGNKVGQGLYTKMTQITAETLGVPLADFFISGAALPSESLMSKLSRVVR